MYVYFSVPNNRSHTYGLDGKATLKTISNMTYFLYVIGHAINHILFCLTNKQIQKETSKILWNCRNMYWTTESVDDKTE